MIYYWIAFFLPAPLFFIKKSKYLFLIFLSLFFSGFSALQSINVSADRQTYFDLFLRYAKVEEFDFSVEPFFYVIFNIFGASLETKVLAFFCICFIGLLVKFYLICRFSPNVALSVFLFISYLYFLQDMNQIRIGFAIGFIYIALLNYYLKKYLYWVFFSFIAVSIHYSSIVCFLAPFFVYRNLSKRFFVFSMVFFLLFSFLWIFGGVHQKFFSFISVFDVTGKVSWYLANNVSEKINPIKRLLPHFIFISILVWKFELLRKRLIFAEFFLSLYFFYIVSFLIFFPVPVFAYRISDIFLFSYLFVVPGILLVIKGDFLSGALVFSYCVFQFIYMVYVIEVFDYYSFIL